ncbi:hypothetical protein F2P79_009544 [Pimephales promelas]|nr:hypothetical protein F2P79_009544 [Pimephales promelas]
MPTFEPIARLRIRTRDVVCLDKRSNGHDLQMKCVRPPEEKARCATTSSHHPGTHLHPLVDLIKV